MKKLFLPLLLLVAVGAIAQSEPFTKRTVITLPASSNPWELVYGPHDSLWVTESKSYIIDRINIANGAKTPLLDLSANKADWTSGTGPQGGLMGLVLHPALYSSDPAVRQAKPWVYVVFVYAKATPNTACPNPGPSCPFSTKLVRYEYKGNALINPVTILTGLPGSSDHNSGRLAIGPDVEPGSDAAHTQYRLYYTIGDMGAGQLTNTSRTNNAQNVDVMEGKVLRINTESDGDAGADAWVPNDNPYYNSAAITPQDYVFSMGHRNPQGLVWANFGAGTYRLYSSEQSDKADDEINLIQAGNNYGWDMVSGKCDGDVNGFQIGGRTITDEVSNCAGTTEPIFTMFHHNTTWPSSYPTGTANAGWPTVAASSIEYYGKNVIPNWAPSLLVTPLKDDKVYRLKLTAGGGISGDTVSYFRGDGNRIRRIISDPLGTKFYVARDNQTITEYRYTGITLPVQLIYFKGSLKRNVVSLDWATSSELNVSKFIIERSTDGVNYTDIGSVLPAGNSMATLTYNFIDNRAAGQLSNVLYYRLRMVDIDNSFKYSDIITITLDGKVEKLIVSPNPVSGITKVIITVPQYGNAQWKVVDNAGITVLQSSIQLNPGINSQTIDMSNLAAGVYYLKVTGAGVDQNVKLQKL